MREEKTIFILAFIIILITSSSIVSSNTINCTNKIVEKSSFDDEVDAPNWNIDDSWTYNIYYVNSFYLCDFFNWNLENLKFIVVDIIDDSYTVDFTGDINGDIDIFPFSSPLEDGTIDGYSTVEKSSIGISEIIAQIEGFTEIPFLGDIPVTIDIEFEYDQPFTCFSFPLFVGKSWSFPTTNISANYSITLLGHTESNHYDKIIPETQFFCNETETISVEAGTFETYKICESQGLIDIYYCASVGNIVKVSGSDPVEYTSVDIELISTSYSSSGEPNKPNQPTGPTTGNPNTSYNYCTSTTDPDEDQVWYLFNWDDTTNSEWLGPYNSGEVVCVDHSWNDNGIYDVKVKAKDENDFESPWSDPLVVTIGEQQDNEDPYVEITSPEEEGIYYYNNKIGYFPFITIIMGYIDIEVEAYDSESGLNRVEFYIDGNYEQTITNSPFIFEYNGPLGIHTIIVTAFDNSGNQASDGIFFLKLF